MTSEELNSLEKLNSKFIEECERVGKIISKVYRGVTPDYGRAPDCGNWSIYDGTVYGNGTDNDGDSIYCEFPAKYLTMSDSELTEMINKMNADYLEEKHRKDKEEKRKREEEIIKHELAELKRLKENTNKENKIMETINHETYVSLEVAKLLKEAGFDWEGMSYYQNGIFYPFSINRGQIINMNQNSAPNYMEQYSAPTLDVAQRWLRETQKYQVAILPNGLKGYAALLFLYKEPITQPFEHYSTYEEALEVGIKKTLEIVLEKGEQHDL